MNINEQELRRRIGSDHLIGNYTRDTYRNAYFSQFGEVGNLVENNPNRVKPLLDILIKNAINTQNS